VTYISQFIFYCATPFLANVVYNCDISMQAPSALENIAERRVLRPRGANGSDNANPIDQPSKGIVSY
jgi:hypothetical protein